MLNLTNQILKQQNFIIIYYQTKYNDKNVTIYNNEGDSLVLSFNKFDDNYVNDFFHNPNIYI